MLEDHGTPDPLTMEALLYACGELEGGQRTAFESRLAADQGARDALCQAVQLTAALKGQSPPVPGLEYRAAVQRRLSRPRGAGRLAWAVLSGAAAAAMLAIVWFDRPVPGPVAGPPAVVQAALPPPAEVEPTPKMASVWAELHNSDHLERTLEEEARRRLRLEERGPRTVKN